MDGQGLRRRLTYLWITEDPGPGGRSENLALVENDDRWLLPLAGRSVERLWIDFAVTLMFGGGLELRIE